MNVSADAEGLLTSLQDGGRPDWAAHDPKLWALALDQLVQHGAFEEARRVACELHRFAPSVSIFASQRLLIEAAPPATGDAAYDAFRDNPEADVQVVQRRAASEVLFIFTGVGGRIGMALPLAHRWFGRLNVHVVYLRDAARQAYNCGVSSLGDSYGASLDGLWRIADGLNARAILTCGNSAGGYGALRHGLDLRARSILAFSAASSLAPPLAPLNETSRRGLRSALDLKPFFLAAIAPPRALLVYGAQCEVDASQAEHLAGVPGVSLHALQGCHRHESMLRAVELGVLGGLLQQLVAP